MTTRIDRSILVRLSLITSMVLFLLILIFIVIDYSENSDDFSDRGATLDMVWSDYYVPYIPEIIRLVSPVAVFTASLLIMGLMTQRREWIALKAGGVSLYRIQRPFLVFGLGLASLVFVLDGFVIPPATAKRLLFERDYVMTRSDRVENSTIYRQESRDHLLTINYYSPADSIAHRVFSYRFNNDRIAETMEIQRMVYQSASGQWRLYNVKQTLFDSVLVTRNQLDTLDVTWSVYPRDMARTTTEVYQLTYPEAWQYIESLKRVGVGGLELPQVQFFGRLAYPLSILIVTLLGVAIASIRFNGGTGMHLGIGLAVSFLYLAMMKLIEPFGYSGMLSPAMTTLFPHLFFLTATLILVWRTPK
jgi:lipopolysaccharide export system permease protein